MDGRSWNVLYEKYPKLFVNKNKTPMESCMSFGIECGLGWYDIISSVCYQIQQHEENERGFEKWKQKDDPSYKSECCSVTFDQIKEKFGGLRIYFSGGDSYIDGVVSMAEEMSYKICETCGSPGRPNKEGWIITLCEKCKEKNNESS